MNGTEFEEQVPFILYPLSGEIMLYELVLNAEKRKASKEKYNEQPDTTLMQ